MKLEFSPVDFYSVHLNSDYHINAAKLANARLAEMLKDEVVVYGSKPDDTSWTTTQWRNTDTHKALLINIEEIKKECKHEPDWEHYARNGKDRCKHCNVPIFAEWREK